MISAWDVYWVMQLDSINVLAIIVMAMFSVVGLGLVLFGATEDAPVQLRVGKRLLTTAAIAALVVGFLPSSKTAAAMIIVPALTSKEVIEPVSREFGELYTLAKIGLTNLVTEDAAKPAHSNEQEGEQ